DHSAPAVRRELQDAGVHADGVLRASLDAEAAEYALAEIDVEALGHLLDLWVRVLFRHDVDAARGAHGLAHHARDAARRAVLPAHQAVQRAQSRREGASLVRILNRHGATGIPAPERVRDVLAHVAEKVARRQHQPRHDLTEIETLGGLHVRAP